MLLLVDISVELSDGFRRILGTAGVSNRDVLILLSLRSSPGLSPSDLAVLLGCSRSMMSQLLRRHLDRGWVRRVPDPADRRSVRLELTRAGLRAVNDLESTFATWVGERRDDIAGIVEEPGSPAPLGEMSLLQSLQELGEAGSGFADDLDAVAAAAGVGDSTQRLALSLLHARGGLRPGQLGKALGLTTSGVSTVLRRLEAAGLVASSRSRLADARAVWVEPTPRGAALAREWLAVVERHEGPLRRALATILAVDRSLATA